MDEDLLKRNTDCVYFLASPLTCKKGADCEFRHSKIARLNPKECWYWLSGNCLNPTCAFRHPPLDCRGGAPSESPPSESAPSSEPAKTSVPCYFYFNGFCNKGDRCSFLHDIGAGASTGKSSKTASACNEAPTHPLENKASTGNDTLTTPAMTHLNPSEAASKATVDTRLQPKEDLDYFEQPVLKDVPQKTVSPQISLSHDEEFAEIRPDLLPAEGSIHGKSHTCTDQSSEEQEDDLVVQEEWWESSPGFDVLVDGKSENRGRDDDSEYFLTLNGERRELNGHFLGYDFENPEEYNPGCPDAELLYERDIYDSYGCPDTKHIFGNDVKFPGYAMDKMSDSILSRKRKLMPKEMAVNDQDFLDLRDCLRRRRATDGRLITGLSRRHESLRLFGRSRERPQRHGMGLPWLGRLAPEVRNSTHELLRENGGSSNAGIQRGSLRHSQRSRKHHEERRLAKQQFPSSRVSKKPVLREKRFAQKSSTFTGPKTLAQIKEEKRKTEDNEGSIGIMERVRRTSVDFQGPKPLNEILKEKGKIDT